MGEALLSQSRAADGKPLPFAERPSYKWWVTWTIMLGAFLFAIDTTIVAIAVPNIMTSISADLNQIQWVLIVYMIGMAVVMPTVGWLSDMMGYKWLYIWSLALFTASSALCGMAWSPHALIFFRFVQGLGAGAIAPTAMAVIFRVFPPQQRGLGMGVYSLGWTFGPILGPTLGGYLTDTISWRAIFYINVPIGIVGVGLAFVVMAADLSQRRPRRLDFIGLVTMTTFIVTVLLALSQGNVEGWNSHYILSLFLIAAASLVFFLVIELWTRDPLVDLQLFRNPTYSVATLVGMFLGCGMFAQNLLVPLFLQDYLEHTALQAAILMLPGVILTGAFSPLVGKLSDQFNPRHFLVLGFLLAAASSFWFAWMGPQPEESTLIWALVVRAGLGFVFPPLMNLGLRTLARDQISAASGLSNITRQISGMAGIAMAAVLLQRWHYAHHLTGAEHLALSGHELDYTEQRLTWLLHSAGEVGGSLEIKLQAMLSRYLTLESQVTAFQDCFIIVGWIFVAAALASVFIPGGADNQA